MSSLPSSPSDRQELKTMLTEMTHCMQRADDEREAKKEIVAEIKRKFDIAPKVANKIAKTMYRRDYTDLQAEHKDFEELYTTLVEGRIIKDN